MFFIDFKGKLKVNKNKKLYKDEYSEENKNFHQDSFLSDKDKSSLDLKGMKTNETKYYDILDESFNKVHPLIYLNRKI